MRASWALIPCLVACASSPPHGDEACVDGLDADADGVCDRLSADWSADAWIPLGTDRANIFALPDDALIEARDAGYAHAFVWPVDVSGLLLPYGPFERLLSGESDDPAAAFVAEAARATLGFGDLDEMADWLGLARFPPDGAAAGMAPPPGLAVGDPMGMGVIERPEGEALTFSCATCHTANLFGRPVMGLTNRRARANEFFYLAHQVFPAISPAAFASLTNATPGELALFERTQANLPAAGAKLPEALGLDTSLAQVALSLSRRAPDAWASRDPAYERSPRPNALESFVADSKPAVWWTLKHKTRWLSDASIRSGNPVFTNFLWNEIGRATDLVELEGWLAQNQRVVDELTVAVFATEAPRWVDHVGPLDAAAARRGEATFEARCASCHGHYEKDWEGADPTRTVRVVYHEQTPVMDVGTDPQRAMGMAHFAEGLNGLAISAWMGAVVEVQPGYAPPPLEGIWARYPYLHNQSVPTLCALLSPESERPAGFFMGPSDVLATDFDADCVGYPLGEAAPAAWATSDAWFDATQPGLSNAGHADFLRSADGAWLLSEADRADLIAFLKTL